MLCWFAPKLLKKMFENILNMGEVIDALARHCMPLPAERNCLLGFVIISCKENYDNAVNYTWKKTGFWSIERTAKN